MSTCMYVRSRISKTTSPYFTWLTPSFPVLWMTSCFHIMELMGKINLATLFGQVRQVIGSRVKSAAILDCLVWFVIIKVGWLVGWGLTAWSSRKIVIPQDSELSEKTSSSFRYFNTISIKNRQETLKRKTDYLQTRVMYINITTKQQNMGFCYIQNVH